MRKYNTFLKKSNNSNYDSTAASKYSENKLSCFDLLDTIEILKNQLRHNYDEKSAHGNPTKEDDENILETITKLNKLKEHINKECF